DGSLRNVSFEAIAAAKQIASDAEVLALVLGNEDVSAYAEEMIKYGADRAVTVVHDHLEHYTSDGYGQAILAVIEDENPDVIVMGHTSIGKDVTPKIAAKLDIGLISDVTEIELDGDKP